MRGQCTVGGGGSSVDQLVEGGRGGAVSPWLFKQHGYVCGGVAYVPLSLQDC